MTKPMTEKECKSALFKLGIKYGIPPRLISERLLSKEDKHDMLQGFISFDVLSLHCKVWIENNMPDYANGNTSIYKGDFNFPMSKYRGIGKRTV